MNEANPENRKIAYFSMEVALDEALPTYAGGLGILAGDTLRSAADLKLPMVGVSLLHRNGYFFQRLDARGVQSEEPMKWAVEDYLEEMQPRVTVQLEGRDVAVRAWRYNVRGDSDHEVPVYLLDTQLEENSEWDRTLTDVLYGDGPHYRLQQEAVLGIGGVRMLRALGYTGIARYHMNEGHASLLALELLDEHVAASGVNETTEAEIAAVRQLCVFTTHTPVPAGHDQFPLDMVDRVLGSALDSCTKETCRHDGMLNMTYLALTLSHYVNGVAKRHGELSRHMFANYQIDSITNGVHAATWASRPMARVFDRYIRGWREDNFSLRYALGIPQHEILAAHKEAKKELIDFVNRETNAGMNADTLTLGFARRATQYKRPDLLFYDVERLRRISRECGRLQLVFAGKAHPRDEAGKQLIQAVVSQRERLRSDVRLVYLPNYDMELARLLVAGVDVWLNTPQPPMEASGTSGMKAALNGVPSLSTLDGWWVEGCIEGVTGWAIDGKAAGGVEGDSRRDAVSLYDKLEQVVVPRFYNDQGSFAEVMRHAIALNGSFFNTHRMLQQYVLNAYFL